MILKKVPKGPLKEGFTTGTSATASAKAGLLAMVTQKKLEQVSVQLPVDKVLEIPVHNCEFGTDWAKCSVLKDAGDDPDVTNGAEVGCEIQLITEKTIAFEAGEGVGTVTLPGLELEVGEPAINPVPRKMITDALNKVLHDYDLECGVLVRVFVTDGKKLAKKTLNERVGIMNGLSILGTTGIVIPYSASSYIASITQGIDVALANGITELIINSGARSEKYLKSLFLEAKEQAFVHYGNWIGETLQKIKETEVKRVTIGIMLGKAVKLARGNTDTHSCVSTWDKPFIATMAKSCGYSQEIQEKILELNMAGRLPELFEFKEGEVFYQALLKECYLQVLSAVGDETEVGIYLISKTGEFIRYNE